MIRNSVELKQAITETPYPYLTIAEKTLVATPTICASGSKDILPPAGNTELGQDSADPEETALDGRLTTSYPVIKGTLFCQEVSTTPHQVL